jgi:hypothetical protein
VGMAFNRIFSLLFSHLVFEYSKRSFNEDYFISMKIIRNNYLPNAEKTPLYKVNQTRCSDMRIILLRVKLVKMGN